MRSSISVDLEGKDLKAVYARVAREIFDDGVVHWGRIVTFFALTIYFQCRFDIELGKEVTDFVKKFFPDWMDNCHVPGGWDVVAFFTNSTFILLSIKLVAACLILEHNCEAPLTTRIVVSNTKTVNFIVYTVFQNTLEINHSRKVFYDCIEYT